jgi:hypothetical protein
MSNDKTRCPAVHAGFGPWDAYCVRHEGHNGEHRDVRARTWFNLSEAIRNDDDDTKED